MMIRDLMDLLSDYDDNTEVFVWNGYNAGSMTSEFEVTPNARGEVALG